MFITLLRYWYVAVTILITGGLTVFLLQFSENRVLVGVLTGVYIFLTTAIFWLIYRKNTYRSTVGIALIITIFGYFGLYLLLEDIFLQRLLGLIIPLCIGAVLYIPQRFAARLAHEYKPWRRMFVSILTAALYSFIATLYGFRMFFQMPATVWYVLLGGIISGLLAYAIFRLYYPVFNNKITLWSVIITLISLEVLWVLAYLPFGYLVLSLLFSWVWYAMVIMIRFHLSIKGIVWKKQIIFLAGSIFGFILTLVFAQWF